MNESELTTTSLSPSSERSLKQSEHSTYDSAEQKDWIWAWMTTIGLQHLPDGVCEDAAGVKVRSDGGVNVVMADGVSGGARGDVASQALVQHCLSWDPQKHPDLQMWFAQETESRVSNALKAVTSDQGASIVAAGWLMPDGQAWFTRVGDCRGYIWQYQGLNAGMSLELLLMDQTLSYMGYSSPYNPLSKSPAHMIGNGNMGDLEWKSFQVPKNTGMVLCSDGLYEFIDHEDWSMILNKVSVDHDNKNDKVLLQGCRQLIELAKARGSEDDISVLLVWRK